MTTTNTLRCQLTGPYIEANMIINGIKPPSADWWKSCGRTWCQEHLSPGKGTPFSLAWARAHSSVIRGKLFFLHFRRWNKRVISVGDMKNVWAPWHIVSTHHNISQGCGPASLIWCHTIWHQVSLIAKPMMPYVIHINIGKYKISHRLDEAMLFVKMKASLCLKIIPVLRTLKDFNFLLNEYKQNKKPHLRTHKDCAKETVIPLHRWEHLVRKIVYFWWIRMFMLRCLGSGITSFSLKLKNTKHLKDMKLWEKQKNNY